MTIIRLFHDVANFDELLDTMPEETLTEFKDMWFNDLRDCEHETDESFKDSANNILSYFGSCWRVLEFSYDYKLDAFVWLCQYVGTEFID